MNMISTPTATNQPSNGGTVTPPAIGCPAWCRGGHAAWQRDIGSDIATDHDSENLASPGASYSLKLYAVDWFEDGEMEIGRACSVLLLNDEVLEPADAILLAADLARVNVIAADTRRRIG